MIWVLIAGFGFAAWMVVVLFFLILCRAAGRADELATDAAGNVFDLRAIREDRRVEAFERAYLSRRERRLSLSSLPSVWQVGQ